MKMLRIYFDSSVLGDGFEPGLRARVCPICSPREVTTYGKEPDLSF